MGINQEIFENEINDYSFHFPFILIFNGSDHKSFCAKVFPMADTNLDLKFFNFFFQIWRSIQKTMFFDSVPNQDLTSDSDWLCRGHTGPHMQFNISPLVLVLFYAFV